MDRLTPEQRSENMRRIRSKHSSPEMAVRRIVHGLGFRFRLHNQRLPGKPDLVFPRLRKIILVHGCFWHSHRRCGAAHVPHPRQEYWKPKLLRTRRRDAASEKKLRREGWDVLTIWECELRDEALPAERICAFLTGAAAPNGTSRGIQGPARGIPAMPW